MGKLTTHVLDTASGLPASGVQWTLYRIKDTADLIREGVTNPDGRSEAPVLEKDEFVSGVYELRFAIGDYFRLRGIKLSDPAFLDTVVIQFGISDSTT
ncbi:MAG: 5-hydroxyisourate hydrolase, partial [Proteobacteria bacterium]|nr:5-hydroxyisourate hydrolase [Pseudomonadota bacterium]